MCAYTTTPWDARTYDANGNTVVRGSGTTDAMYYDYRNRMVEYVSGSTGQVHKYAYDAFGRRYKKTTDWSGPQETTTQYYYDDAWRIVEKRVQSVVPPGLVDVVTYVNGEGIDELVGMQRDDNHDTVMEDYFYHADDMGNVTEISDAAALVVERIEYGDYGLPLDGASLSQLTASVAGNDRLFNGREYDWETGLYYYRTRYMEPETGRFTTRDSIGVWGDPGNYGNGYSYTGSNPWSRLDPLGLCDAGLDDWTRAWQAANLSALKGDCKHEGSAWNEDGTPRNGGNGKRSGNKGDGSGTQNRDSVPPGGGGASVVDKSGARPWTDTFSASQGHSPTLPTGDEQYDDIPFILKWHPLGGLPTRGLAAYEWAIGLVDPEAAEALGTVRRKYNRLYCEAVGAYNDWMLKHQQDVDALSAFFMCQPDVAEIGIGSLLGILSKSMEFVPWATKLTAVAPRIAPAIEAGSMEYKMSLVARSSLRETVNVDALLKPGVGYSEKILEQVVRPLAERRADFLLNPHNWERTAAFAEQARSVRGGVSVESTYTNAITGETIHVHDVFKSSGGQIRNHPTFRDYSKGGQ